MFFWVGLFYFFAIFSSLFTRLPAKVWRILFVLPYLFAFAESLNPFLEKNFNFPRDGLSDFFACLVTGIGICVSLYAGCYFSKNDSKKFFPLLFFFTGSMLGILWVDHVFAFFTFWEATSLCSFMLIAFNYKSEEVRKKAKQALIVNIACGLALLLGLLILSEQAGSYSLTQILNLKNLSEGHSTLLILLFAFAAMTKSAQFPFHFWLPNAMQAPTPASCYLHSATMVKLGVFLIARFSPLFEGLSLWTTLLTIVGAITLILGLLVSLVKTDLKQLFAWTTVSSLGGMFILVGLPFEYSWKAFFSYIFAHSCYKASLFLCVGNIDKQIGTRNIYDMTHLTRRMPLTSFALVLSLGSMIGLPFSLGFLGKEYLLKSALLLKGASSLLLIVLVCSSALSIVVTFRILKLIFRKESRPSRVNCEAPWQMWLPALILASVGWVSSFFLKELNEYFLNPVVSSIVLKKVDMELQMWTGLNAAIGLSLASLILGFILIRTVGRHLTRVEMWLRFDQNIKARLDIPLGLAQWTTRFFQNGRLSHYLFYIVIPTLLTALFFFADLKFIGTFDFKLGAGSPGQILAALFTLSGLVGIRVGKTDLAKVLALGLVGYGVGLFFLAAQATDLAMTQISVETMSLLLFLLCLKTLKSADVHITVLYQTLRTVVCGAAFVGVLWLCVFIEKDRVPSTAGEFFNEHAATLGQGLNTVNVILVDFRALDTMGESLVLALVALGTSFLFRPRKTKEHLLKKSALVQAATPYLLGIFSLVCLYLLFRGHNSPGGGFIAGVVGAVSFSFYVLVFGESSLHKWIRFHPRQWIAGGLILCLLSGFFGTVLRNEPPFTSYWIHDSLPGVGTPLLFDLGVFLVVIGVGLSLSLQLSGRSRA